MLMPELQVESYMRKKMSGVENEEHSQHSSPPSPPPQKHHSGEIETTHNGQESQQHGEDEGIAKRSHTFTSIDVSALTAPVEQIFGKLEEVMHSDLFSWHVGGKDAQKKEEDELYQRYANTAAASFVNPACAGFLTKLGEIHKTWRKRYFILDGCMLIYYKGPHAKQPRELLTLQTVKY